MKKSLIALAIAGIVAAPAAMADEASVYGQIDMSFGAAGNGTNSATQIASNTSKVGIKGSENMGGGTSVVWAIEQQIDIGSAYDTTNKTTTNAKNTFATRNSFLGLKDDSMGTILLGIHDVAYKEATRHLDPFGDGMADSRAVTGGGHDNRLTQTVYYKSPSMNGLTAVVSYTNGGNQAAGSNTLGLTKGDDVSLALMYDQNPFKIHFGYDDAKMGTALGEGKLVGTAGDKSTAWKLGGSYDFGMFTLGGVYEHYSTSGVSAGFINDAGGKKVWTLNGVVKVSGSDAVKVAYAKAGDFTATANTGAKQTSIGYDHHMSKRTTLYFVYTRVSNDSLGTYSLADTSTGNPHGGILAGNSVHAYGIGLKHAF